MHYQRSPRLWKMLAASTLAFLFSFSALSAQTWEWVYGEPGVPTRDGGRRGVIPVAGDFCNLPNGYISVGYSDASGNSDVYVVRTNCRGQRIWEFTYDITGNGDQDYGRSIAPVRNAAGQITGYVIGGWTSANGQDAIILSIDCNGAVLWANSYGGPNTSEGAHDILVTTSGDPTCVPATNPGDIVLGGWANTATGSDGYIVRTNAGGALLWDATYDNGGMPPSMEIFMAITEVAPMPPAVAGGVPPTGDIMGIGIMHSMMIVPPNPPPSPQAWVVRVNGCNGAIGAAPQGSASYGLDPGPPDGFFSGIELQNPASSGWTGAFDFAGFPVNRQNVALIGDYNATDIYLVELQGGNPVTPVIETVVGAANETDFGRDIKEITTSTAGFNTPLVLWDLLITGHNDDPNTAAPGDLYVYALAPGFVPLFGSLFSTGGAANGSETGWSLFPDNGATCRFGVIACGTSNANPLGLNPPDPEDLYLVKTNGFLKTNCSAPYNPPSFNVTTVVQTFPAVGLINWSTNQNPVTTKRAMGLQVCAFGMKESPTTGDELSFETMVDASASPNPIAAGETLMLQVTNAIDGRVSLTLSNSIGETVKAFDNVELDGAGVLTVSTEELPAGVYNATVRSGSENVTVRVVVTK